MTKRPANYKLLNCIQRSIIDKHIAAGRKPPVMTPTKETTK